MRQRILLVPLALCVALGLVLAGLTSAPAGAARTATTHAGPALHQPAVKHTTSGKHAKPKQAGKHQKPKPKKPRKPRKPRKPAPPAPPLPPAPPVPPVPPVPTAPTGSGTLFGANFGSGPDESLYQGRADVARLYYQAQIPADLPRTAAFAEAYGEGVRTFVVSWKDGDDSRVAQALDSLPPDVRVYGTYFHEPEDDIEKGGLTLAAWTARTNAQAAIMRRHGVVPTSILMAFTVVGGKGRRVSDYYGADVDVFGFDYYPDKLGQSPTTVIGQMAAASAASGSGRMLLGEFGILTDAPNGAALVTETRAALARAGAEVACYWSQDLHRLTTGVAASWFG